MAPTDHLLPTNDIAGQAGFGLEAFLARAVAMAEALASRHAEGIVFRTLTPASFETGNDGAVSLKTPEAMRPGSYVEFLTYSSPEQTGRTSRGVDRRTDYYSFGVILYELATGNPPFRSTDPMQLVHGHLARVPVSPEKLNPGLPIVVGRLILKLLAKRPEERYQSDAGLIADLRHCLDEARHGRRQPDDFPLGGSDIPDRLQVPQKLYGREHEVGLLYEALDRAAQGNPELVLVGGYSGIGKSSLVQEIRAPLTARHGFLLTGKFDQLKRSTPYSAIAQALDSLLKLILAESEEKLLEWRSRLSMALGANACLLADLLPRLEKVLGALPDPAEYGSADTQGRFNTALSSMLRMLARPEHPLVLFLDDLQWADAASLKLIKEICARMQDASLLLIGAYRDNEVDASHPLTGIVEEIRAGPTGVRQITVSELPPVAVEDMLADAFRCPAAEVRELSERVVQKTGGNPFFIHQFLETLHREKALFLDERGRWRWHAEAIDRLGITENVVDLLARAMASFPEGTRLAVSCGAAIGNTFNLATLATVLEQDVDKTYDDLRPALQSGLLLEIHDILEATPLAEHGFRFLHDRVQQAAYEMVKMGGQPALHYRIGQLLLANSQIGSISDDRLFMLVEHLNCGAELIRQDEERSLAALLNFMAARKAKLSAAFAIALEYLAKAAELLPPEHWQTAYQFSFDIHFERADIERLSGNFAETDRLCALLMEHADSSLHRAMVHEVLLERHKGENNYRGAIAAGLAALALFGIRLPLRPTPLQYGLALLRLNLAGVADDSDAVLQRPPMSDPTYIILTRIIASLLPCVWNGSPLLWPSLIYEQSRILAKHGLTGVSFMNYSTYAVILCSNPDTIPQGERIGKLSVDIAEKFGDAGLKARAMMSYAAFFAPWTRPLAETPAMLMDVYEYAASVGDLEYLNYALVFAYTHQFLSGTPLPKLTQLSRRYKEIFKRFGSNQFRLTYAIDSMVIALSGRDQDLIPADFNEAEFLESARQARHFTSLFYFGIEKTVNAYLRGDYAAAIDSAEQAIDIFWIFQSRAMASCLNQYYALSLLAACDDAPHSARIGMLWRVRRLQRTMATWARHAPTNFAHKWHLIEAERLRLLGRNDAAALHYDSAISGARRNGYQNDDALACELAGKFHHHQGDLISARHYLEEARSRYHAWGAYAQSDRVDRQYRGFLTDRRRVRRRDEVVAEHSADKTIDLSTIIRASQALSREVQLPPLLARFMRLIVENAGADRGWLIALGSGSPRVLARSEESTVSVAPEARPLADGELPVSLINYVRRTRELLLLDDVRLDSRFSNDPYFLTANPGSLLCVPLLQRDQLTGLLYLENRLISHAFSAQRVELMQALAGQLAISMENAELIDDLETKVAHRTEELSTKNRELLETQKQLVEAEKMASLGQLVAGVAHEINTPIGVSYTAITHFASQTRSLVQTFENGQVRKSDMGNFLSLATDTGEQLIVNLSRASQLIQSFKQVAVDQSYDDIRRFELGKYLAELVVSLTPALRKSGIRVELDCPDEISLLNFPGALSQVLTNLMMNAVTHAFAGCSEGLLRLSARRFGENVEITCTDNGRGIPPDILPKIFDPFFTTRRGDGGSGLGLHIAYNLVTQKMRGRIGCDSKPGEGTRFWLTLPAELQ